jgi:predicted ATPase
MEADPIQLQALSSLERLYQDLATNPLPETAISSSLEPSSSSSSSKSSSSGAGGFFSWMSSSSSTASSSSQSSSSFFPGAKIRGVYLHGGVGCGKTFLMNKIFYDSIVTGPWSTCKQKTHFHKFMLRIHQDMHMSRKNGVDGDKIIPAVVSHVVEAGKLLCFDEFQVTDVADALILQRLFTGLWEQGCVVVATSNRPPEDLYLNGLQRDRFLPFIQLLKQECQVVSMWESEKDYRLILKSMDAWEAPSFSTSSSSSTSAGTTGAPSNTNGDNGEMKPRKRQSQKVYFEGGREARKEFDELFYDLVGASVSVSPTALRTQGRNVSIPQASLVKGIARFQFEDLCQKALGAADYLIIGQHFHTVFVENIPILNLSQLNWVRRFITFVDSMYESNCKLILHAKTDAKHIFQPEEKTQDDEVFAFDRTVSRLEEMSSSAYLVKQQRKVSKSTESKAGLLSQRRATVNVIPSLGDSIHAKYL